MDKKEYVLNAFRSGQNVYLRSLAKELRLEIKEVIWICKKLVNQGKIHIHDEEAFYNFYLPQEKKKNWFGF